MDTRKLVTELGGITAVAALLAVTPQTVCGWTTNRVPARHWLRLWRLAKERGVEWRPPGAEGLDLVILPPSAADDAEGRMFTQCSLTPPVEEAA